MRTLRLLLNGKPQAAATISFAEQRPSCKLNEDCPDTEFPQGPLSFLHAAAWSRGRHDQNAVIRDWANCEKPHAFLRQIPAACLITLHNISLILMPAIFEYHHRVVAEEIDGAGHVNNIEYLRWLQDAAVAHSSAQGWPPHAYRQLGLGWVVRSHFIEYLRPAFVDDEIIVRTWIADMKRVTSLRRYELLRGADGKQLVIASTNWAFVEFATHQPRRVPAEVLNSFELVPDPAV